jgi:hypothetical protein
LGRSGERSENPVLLKRGTERPTVGIKVEGYFQERFVSGFVARHVEVEGKTAVRDMERGSSSRLKSPWKQNAIRNAVNVADVSDVDCTRDSESSHLEGHENEQQHISLADSLSVKRRDSWSNSGAATIAPCSDSVMSMARRGASRSPVTRSSMQSGVCAHRIQIVGAVSQQAL